MKKLAKELKKQFTCLRENVEKYITFTVPIEKELAMIDKKGKEIIQNISYILQFIDSARFIELTISNLVNKFPEGTHRIKCKYGHYDKICETCEIEYKYCNSFLECMHFKDGLIEYKCFSCNKNDQLLILMKS